MDNDSGGGSKGTVGVEGSLGAEVIHDGHVEPVQLTPLDKLKAWWKGLFE